MVRHVGKIERLARALLVYGAFDDDDVIRAVAGLPLAPAVVDWWARQFDGAEVVEVRNFSFLKGCNTFASYLDFGQSGGFRDGVTKRA